MKKENKYRSIILSGLLVCLLTACGGESKPKEVLEIDQMIPVLKDLQIAYAGVDQTIKNPKERAAKYEEMNSLVLKKNKLEKGQFYTSYQWYEVHPALLDTILKQVVQSLNVDLQTLQNGGAVPPSK